MICAKEKYFLFIFTWFFVNRLLIFIRRDIVSLTLFSATAGRRTDMNTDHICNLTLKATLEKRRLKGFLQ